MQSIGVLIESTAAKGRLWPPSPTRGEGRRNSGLRQSIQREAPRIPTQIRRRVERLAVDRAIVVLAGERGVAELRRVGVVGKFAVARKYFGAGVEPGASGHINPCVRSLLIGHIRTIGPVIGTAAIVIFLLRAGLRHRETDRDKGNERHRKLVRSGEFPGHLVLLGLADRQSSIPSSIWLRF